MKSTLWNEGLLASGGLHTSKKREVNAGSPRGDHGQEDPGLADLSQPRALRGSRAHRPAIPSRAHGEAGSTQADVSPGCRSPLPRCLCPHLGRGARKLPLPHEGTRLFLCAPRTHHKLGGRGPWRGASYPKLPPGHRLLSS